MALGTLAKDAMSSSLQASLVSWLPRLLSIVSATAAPLEALSWATAFCNELLICVISPSVSRSLRSMSWALIRYFLSAALLVHSREVTMRIRRMSPRVCWKPGFSRKRA